MDLKDICLVRWYMGSEIRIFVCEGMDFTLVLIVHGKYIGRVSLLVRYWCGYHRNDVLCSPTVMNWDNLM